MTLAQMLMAREWRADYQAHLLQTYGRPVICFTMNIPGAVKLTPLIRRSFYRGLTELENALPNVVFRKVREEHTGCEAYFAVDADALELKALCTRIEDATPLGRLFDMDATDTDGSRLDRRLVNGSSRDCIVCGAPGRGCASRRIHSAEVLMAATDRIMTDYFYQEDSHCVADLAVQSLLDEVHTTPKPGLVDQRNSGSHRDMDLPMFVSSAEALSPYFLECFCIGHDTAEMSPEDTFYRLRQAGIRAEREMFRVTGGINTHKGAIFTLGILCGALGRLWKPDSPIAPLEDITDQCAAMGKVSLLDFEHITVPTTAGEELFKNHGRTGIRGETAAGLPSVVETGLACYRMAQSRGYSSNDSAAVALVHLIARVDDSNLYHRGGASGAAWAKREAEKLLPLPDMVQILDLDDRFIARNLSPGGCADLLAAMLFLASLYE